MVKYGIRGPIELGPIHEFLQVLYEIGLWKWPFYYAKMSNFWGEVRIPHFPTLIWPLKTLWLTEYSKRYLYTPKTIPLGTGYLRFDSMFAKFCKNLQKFLKPCTLELEVPRAMPWLLISRTLCKARLRYDECEQFFLWSGQIRHLNLNKS